MVKFLVQVEVGIHRMLGTMVMAGIEKKVKRRRMDTKGTATEHAASSSQSTKGTATEHAASSSQPVHADSLPPLVAGAGPFARHALRRRLWRGDPADLAAMQRQYGDYVPAATPPVASSGPDEPLTDDLLAKTQADRKAERSQPSTATEHATSRASLVQTGPGLRQRLIRRAGGEVLDPEAMQDPEAMLDADLERLAEIPHVRDPVTLVIAIPEVIKTPPDTEDELEEISS